MKKVILVGLCLIHFTLASNEIMFTEGQQIFVKNCATCHGQHAEKKAFGHSAIINQFDESAIIKALQLRKSGEIQGAGNKAKSRLNSEQIQAVATYIRTLKKNDIN